MLHQTFIVIPRRGDCMPAAPVVASGDKAVMAIEIEATMRTREMMDTHPAQVSLDRDLLARTVDALVACSQACTACADACLSEEMVSELRTCIRLNLDCADICGATARMLSRHTGSHADRTRAQLQACSQVCRSCGDECRRHAEAHDHCRIGAEACRACDEAGNELLAAIS
ncbi:four-helix bundle copper-binding protein [Pseudactinotalea sp. Z1748]|uniref:four-helix bundle copper-binding protein n=1 Tax=Pseudactinotalea sp. Z1748 TaxID=3413027 RepID=UPI003C7D8B76